MGKEPVDMIFRTPRHEIIFDKMNLDDFEALAIQGGFKNSGYYEDVFDERFQNVKRKSDKDRKNNNSCL